MLAAAAVGASAKVVAPNRIGTNNTAEPNIPAVAVDNAGDAYIAWAAPSASSTQLDFCKVSPDSTGCNIVPLPVPAGAQFFDPPSVIHLGNYVIRLRSGRRRLEQRGRRHGRVGVDRDGAAFSMVPHAVSIITGVDAFPDQSPVIQLPRA